MYYLFVNEIVHNWANLYETGILYLYKQMNIRINSQKYIYLHRTPFILILKSVICIQLNSQRNILAFNASYISVQIYLD